MNAIKKSRLTVTLLDCFIGLDLEYFSTFLKVILTLLLEDAEVDVDML